MEVRNRGTERPRILQRERTRCPRDGERRIWRCPTCAWWRDWSETRCCGCGALRDASKPRNRAPSTKTPSPAPRDACPRLNRGSLLCHRKECGFDRSATKRNRRPILPSSCCSNKYRIDGPLAVVEGGEGPRALPYFPGGAGAVVRLEWKRRADYGRRIENNFQEAAKRDGARGKNSATRLPNGRKNRTRFASRPDPK